MHLIGLKSVPEIRFNSVKTMSVLSLPIWLLRKHEFNFAQHYEMSLFLKKISLFLFRFRSDIALDFWYAVFHDLMQEGPIFKEIKLRTSWTLYMHIL